MPLSHFDCVTSVKSYQNRLNKQGRNDVTLPKPTLPADSEIQAQVSFVESGDIRGTYQIQINTVPVRQTRTTGTLIDPLGIVGNTPGSTAKRLDETTPSPILDLSNALKESTEPDEFNNRLQAIAKTAGVTVYCEYFPTDKQERLKTRGTPHELLNELAQRHAYNVVKRGDAYFLWGKVWFKDRLNTVPEAWLALWRERAQKEKQYTLEDVLAMARLTDGQIDLLTRMPFAPLLNPVNVAYLRILGLFNAEQKQKAFSLRGLSSSELSQAQRQAVSAVQTTAALGQPTAGSSLPFVFRAQTTTDERGLPRLEMTVDGANWPKATYVCVLQPQNKQPSLATTISR